MQFGFTMVPTAKRKMQNFIQKHDSVPVNPHGPTSPPRTQHPVQTADPDSPSPQPPRHDALESMKLPLPTSMTARWANVNANATQAAPMSPPATAPGHYQHIRRSRTASQDGRETAQRDRARQDLVDSTSRPNNKEIDSGQTWDEAHVGSPRPRETGLREVWDEQSNIHSLFSDSETRSVTTKHNNKHEDRQLDGRGIRSQLQYERNGHRPTVAPPFVVTNKNGELQIETLEPQVYSSKRMLSNPPRTAVPLSTSLRQDPFGSPSEPEIVPKKGHNLLRTKVALRSGDEFKRPTHLERTAYPLGEVIKSSAGYHDTTADAAAAQRKPKKENELDHKRSTIFQDVDEPMSDSDILSDQPSQGDEIEMQHTPKPSRQQTQPVKAAATQKAQKPAAPPMPQKIAAPQKKPLEESPIPRTVSAPVMPSRKRRHSVDYDDEVLQEMSYSDLRGEPFDHDPARLAVQSPARPSPDNLQDRIQYFKTKDENSQHHFFTELSVREWEDCGDWFMEQFGSIVQKMKEARQAKRKMVDQYETEVANREEAVRKKKDHLERKLDKLRNDCDSMLKGKEADD